ncbi:MAG: arylsulfatase [Planctomycetes bacterium]|nr:arylsulfatase [Planctomycetota bacterium]
MFGMQRFVPVLIAFAGASVGMGASLDAPQRPAQRPNIIFILADDLGQFDLGCYGQKNILTPNLDRMAAEGMRFTQCYAGAAVCAPSRCCLMTGLHTGHARVRSNSSRVGGVPPQGRVPLIDEDLTVAEVLKSVGYATGITGKWGLGEPNTSGVPNRQGFDEWFGFLNQRHAHTYYPEYIWRNEQFEIVWGNMGGYENQWIHDDFTRFALEFIKQHRRGPFFLYLAYTVPHGRYEIPDDEPYSDRPWPDSAKRYAAMVTRLDADVGKLFALLKKLGIDERTIVFFGSDNGATYTDPPIHSAGPLRGKKGTLYEGGIRTPMIVRWPGRIAAGRVSDQVWAFWDFLPTAAELAGASIPEGIDGISIVPTLFGRPQRQHDFLYWEFPTRRYPQAVRQGVWKGVRKAWNGPIELYNLRDDPSEQRDVAGQHPNIVAGMDAIMRAQHTDSPFWPVPKK